MTQRGRKDVYLGKAISAEVRRLAVASRRSISGQIVYLCELALDAPVPTPVALDHIHLDDQDGRVTVHADEAFFARIEARVSRTGYHSGESRSEACRALLLEGMAIEREARAQVQRIYEASVQEASA